MSNRFETTFLTAWDKFVVNECKTVTTMVGAAPIILARNLRVSSFNGKIPLCQLCGILLYPEAKVHVQVEDHTGCVSANMIGETAETFLQCSGLKLMQITALENQDILNDIRASTTEEHMLYLKVINNNKKTVALKYDVVFMLEPILDINTALNIGENPVRGFMVEEKSAHRTCINKQPIKAYALPVLSPTDPVSGRNNAIHTCFQTNKVIASQNITDLRLVANIANQKFMMADINDGARIVKPWTVIVANLLVRIENSIRVDIAISISNIVGRDRDI
ncbi:replication protein A 70 kDa DNA-binding subunit B-like [Forsythia ovata]|uniref:Replication protein A 70 kDa DNA-binding subunit B-like n=1 Tax=Forsythia ovata TaxID=205694 RepID=A0ABD1U871_9LAMI